MGTSGGVLIYEIFNERKHRAAIGNSSKYSQPGNSWQLWGLFLDLAVLYWREEARAAYASVDLKIQFIAFTSGNTRETWQIIDIGGREACIRVVVARLLNRNK